MSTIRAAKLQDLPQILEVYAIARAFMARTGNPNQWGNTNPTRQTILTHIENGNLYVLEDEEIEGVFAFIPGEDPTYGYIEGQWQDDSPYAAIHCVASAGREKGMFPKLLAFCEARCSHLRIDTHRDNLVMQHVITKHGFRYRGVIYLANGDPRLAYERS